MPGQLHISRRFSAGVRAAIGTLRLELRHIERCHFVAGGDGARHLGAVDPRGQRAGSTANLCAPRRIVPPDRTPRAAFDAAGAVLPLGDQRDHGLRGIGIEFGAVGAGQAAHVAGVLDRCELHAEADPPRNGTLFSRAKRIAPDFSSVPPCRNRRHEDRVHLSARPSRRARFLPNPRSGYEPCQRVWIPACVNASQRLVRIGQVEVFADERDVGLVLGVIARVDQVAHAVRWRHGRGWRACGRTISSSI